MQFIQTTKACNKLAPPAWDWGGARHVVPLTTSAPADFTLLSLTLSVSVSSSTCHWTIFYLSSSDVDSHSVLTWPVTDTADTHGPRRRKKYRRHTLFCFQHIQFLFWSGFNNSAACLHYQLDSVTASRECVLEDFHSLPNGCWRSNTSLFVLLFHKSQWTFISATVLCFARS